MGCPEPSVPRDYNITHCTDNKSSLAEWVSIEVNINSSSKSIGNAEERRSEVVSPSVWIDTTLKVSVTTEHTHCNKITLTQKNRTLFPSVSLLLNHSLTHSTTYSLTHSPTQSLTQSFTHSLTYSSTHPPTHSHTHPLTHPLTHLPTHSLTHLPTHSLTHLPTHSHTHRFNSLHHTLC